MSPLLTEQSPTTQGVLWQPPTSVGGQPASATTDPAGNKTAGPGDQHHAPQPAGHAQHTQAIDDRVAVPRQNADRDTVASTQNAHTAHRAAPTVAVAVHQDSGVAMASQPDPPPDAQRNSSFKGLPPIRRNSSFGLSSIDVMQEAEQRVSADDEASAAATQNGSHQHEQTHVNQHEATLQPTENATNQSMGVDSNATLVGQDGTNRTGRSSLSKEPMRYYQPPTQPPSQQLQYDLSVPSQLQQGQGQRPAGHPGSGSPQPPSGWRLEESHLSEPLHVARRRAGTENSQQPSAYGLEKETGVPGPMSPESTGYEPGPAPAAPAALAPAGPPAPTLAPGPQPPRGRTSDVPPSSAQRYPELFRPAGQPQQQQQYGYGYANPQDQPMPGYKPYPPRVSYDGKAHESGFEATSAQAEERGRRKSSGIFKGIGDRFARATSRERRTSVSDQGPAQLNMQNGSNYPTEQPQEPKKRRPSFILASLRSRPSMDAVSSHRPDSPAMSQTQESQAPEGSIMSKSEKKKSLLGSKISAAQQKFIPGSISRSSTPSLVNDTASTGTGAGANDNPSMGPPKKRFSGFADKAAGFTSRFRQGHDGHQKPGTSHSAVSSASGLPQDPAGQVSSPAPKAPGRNIGTSDSTSSFKMAPPHPPHSRDRSGSGGSFGMASPPAPGSEQQERRGRRGSFTGMMSNLMGGRSSSKSRQSEEPQQPALQNFYGPQHNAAPSGPVPQPPVHREIPSPTSPPSAHGRTPSWDGSQRASRHLSGGYVQPSRPSPLAQESSATAGESAVHPDANRSVHSPAPPSERQYAASPTKTASDGRMSPMPASQARDATQSPGPSATPGPKESEAPKSPLASSGASASGSEQPPQAESQTPGEPSKSPASDDAPISPVKRQPTPHTTALLSSMAATSESQPPVPDLPPQSQTPTQPTAQAPQTTTQDSPASHVRHDSPISQTTQRQTPQVPVGPSREGTPVAQPQQQQPPPPPQQAASPVRPYGNQPPPQQGPVALNGPPGGRYPQQPLGAPGHQNQQMYKQPPGPPPQRRAPNGQFPQQQPSGPPMQQGFSQQAAPAQGQPPATQPEGQEPKWKGWKNRVSNQMAQMTAPSGQGKQEGEAKPQKESWKNRFSSQLAQAPPQGNEVKTEKPTKEGKPGWKDKVTGQLSQIAPQSGQDKHEKSDKTSTGDKLFGAFKKGPKPGESTAPAPPPKTSPQRPPVQPEQQQWRPSPAQQGRGMPPQQWAGHPAYGQYAYQGQVRPGPPTMLPGQYQQYQQQPPHPQQQQYQQAQWAAAGQPPPAQQQWPAYGQQQVRRPPEPQYDSVPIPKGYNAVHGEGSTAPTNYNVGRQVSPQGQYFGGQQSYAQQQGDFPQGQAPAGQSPVMSPPVAAGASQQVQQIQQTAPVRSGSATPGEHGGFNLPIQGNVTPGDEPQTSPLRGGRPPNVRHASVVSDAGYSIESGALGGTGQRVLPPGQPQQGHHLQTQSSTASLNAQAPSRGSSQVSSSTEVAQPKQSVPRRPVSLSPDAALEGKYESNAKNLTVDVEKSKQDTDDIYDVTPRLHQDRTGVSDVSKSNSNGSAEAPKSPVKDKQDEDAAHIELEDTADARMRTMRLNSQEEKIFYDPEGDIPKMSATSYPGQEWNPYGEPEFADFRDD